MKFLGFIVIFSTFGLISAFTVANVGVQTGDLGKAAACTNNPGSQSSADHRGVNVERVVANFQFGERRDDDRSRSRKRGKTKATQ